jgi:hypothetical protein
MKKLSVTCAALLFALTLAVSAADEKTENKELQPAPNGMPVTASGKIVSTFTCKCDGSDTEHTFVKVKGSDGEVDVVDLGPTEGLKNNFDAKEGQQIFVSGRIGTMNGKPIVFAETFSETKMVSIDRTPPLASSDKKDGHSAADHNKMAESSSEKNHFHTVEGRVLGSRAITFENGKEEQIFAKLQTDDGVVVVNLGPKSGLSKIDYSDGQSIMAAGYVARLNGKPFIKAHAAGNMNPIQQDNKVGAVETK